MSTYHPLHSSYKTQVKSKQCNCAFYSRAPVAQIIETEPCVLYAQKWEPMQLSFYSQHSKWHGSRAHAPNDNDDIAQHGSHPANTKSCSIGLQHISLIPDIHIVFN